MKISSFTLLIVLFSSTPSFAQVLGSNYKVLRVIDGCWDKKSPTREVDYEIFHQISENCVIHSFMDAHYSCATGELGSWGGGFQQTEESTECGDDYGDSVTDDIRQNLSGVGLSSSVATSKFDTQEISRVLPAATFHREAQPYATEDIQRIQSLDPEKGYAIVHLLDGKTKSFMVLYFGGWSKINHPLKTKIGSQKVNLAAFLPNSKISCDKSEICLVDFVRPNLGSENQKLNAIENQWLQKVASQFSNLPTQLPVRLVQGSTPKSVKILEYSLDLRNEPFKLTPTEMATANSVSILK